MSAAPNVISLPVRYGATALDWAHFTLLLGLAEDLLPVVSNPNAKISADSKMKGLGKTPSRYNRAGEVVGIADWTHHQTTAAEIDAWAKLPDLGICLQTRTVRALDCDISDPTEARAVARVIADQVGLLPRRTRSTSSKFLMAFNLPGDMPKRVIKTAHGMIEFLGSGQQFIAAGAHIERDGVSRSRYEWVGGLPDDFPTITREQFEKLWAVLAEKFAIEPPTESAASTKVQKLAQAAQSDPVGKYLLDNGWVKSTERDGRLHVRCPFESGHSSDSGDSSTTYFPAHTGGYEHGHFSCLHASCQHRKDDDFRNEIGISQDDFDVVVHSSAPGRKNRFLPMPASEFVKGATPRWIVKGVLPQAGLAVVFGDSGSGKSFFMVDLAASIARGSTWCGKRTKQGRIVYVVAEGAGGFRTRLQAYARQHHVELEGLPLDLIGDAPNMMKVDDVKELIAGIKFGGDTSVVVIDTFAQVMPGANENSGEDVGKALAHCREVHRATGALVVLVHHSGKDASRGARGWSGLRAAADVEIEVSRGDDERVARVSKQKDGIEGLEFGFRLMTVTVGVDEEGEDISSCVVEHCEAVPKAQRKKEPKGNVQRLVLRLANQMTAEGERLPVNDLIVATVNNIPMEEGGRDRRREAVLYAITSLAASGQISTANGVVEVLP